FPSSARVGSQSACPKLFRNPRSPGTAQLASAGKNAPDGIESASPGLLWFAGVRRPATEPLLSKPAPPVPHWPLQQAATLASPQGWAPNNKRDAHLAWLFPAFTLIALMQNATRKIPDAPSDKLRKPSPPAEWLLAGSALITDITCRNCPACLDDLE